MARETIMWSSINWSTQQKTSNCGGFLWHWAPSPCRRSHLGIGGRFSMPRRGRPLARRWRKSTPCSARQTAFGAVSFGSPLMGRMWATPASSSQINLAWTPSTDNVAVAGYKIFRNGTQVGTSATNKLQRHRPCRKHRRFLHRLRI
jgi:hypothetical protein